MSRARPPLPLPPGQGPRGRGRSPTPEKLVPPAKRPRSEAPAHIVGLTGTLGAGKGACAKYLVDRGFKHWLIRDYLIDLVRERGLEPTRDNLLQEANRLREQHGAAVLVQRLCAEAQKLGGRHVIDSVRTLGEVAALQSAGAVLLSVEADQRARYGRISLRKSTTDSVSFEKFCEDDEREMHSEDSTKPSLRAVMHMADHRLTNDGELGALHAKLDSIFSRWVCIVGPHGTGKSVLLTKVTAALRGRGVVVDVCEELARDLILDMRLSQQDFNDFNDKVVEFQRRLLDLYAKRHAAARGRALLSDRSALDQLAYLEWQVGRGRLQPHVLEAEWQRALAKDLRSLYAEAHFVLMAPQPGLCKDDGTRMMSSLEDQMDLHGAFVRVLERAGLRFRSFSALRDDPDNIVRIFGCA